jgi:hypothetical protein
MSFKKYSEIKEALSLVPKHINDLSDEQQMAIDQLRSIIMDASQLIILIANDGKDLPAFMQSKITLSKDYISKSREYMSNRLNDKGYNDETEEIGK